MPVSTPTSEKTATIAVAHVGASALYLAYLQHTPAVREWYPHAPLGGKLPERSDYPAERRGQVAAILEAQNRGWGAGEATFRNIDRLRQGASAIVTGQQVGIFGGPLYSVLKALTAIKLAEQHRAVPIFWLATEDHDLAEVSFTNVLSPEHELRKLSLQAKDEGHRAGDVKLPASVTRLTEELKDFFGANEVTDLLARCYAPGTTFADSFAQLFTHLFSDFGLILIDNRDPQLHKVAAPVFTKAAAHAVPLNQALQRRNQELQAAGFHAQVHVENSSSLLFHHQNGRRVAIKIEGDSFHAGKSDWSATDLAKEVQKAPESFSANALLRPVIQDYVLPTIAYVGGAAEIAYFAQSEVLYRELLGRVTPVLPRASTTLIEPGVARLLEKFDLEPFDAFVPAEQLRMTLAARALPVNVQHSFDDVSEKVEAGLTKLEQEVADVDPTLLGAAQNAGRKMRYQLRRLSERAARAHLRKQAEMDRQLRRISNSLHPNDNLQERELGSIYFLAKHGIGILKTLHASLRTDTADHQIVWL
jgi:bacillithiol biosynthesis cysteine-adding enzyme BshC